MVDVLIFSKDRPAQLDLLLRSIDRYAPNLYRTRSILVHRWSEAYERVYRAHPRWHFYNEIGYPFEGFVRMWLDPSWHAGSLISFLVDDDVFYRDPGPSIPWPRDYIKNELLKDTGLSLRGGDYDYPLSVDGNIYRREHIQTVIDGMPRGWSNPTQLEAVMHEFRHLAPFDHVNPVSPPCLTGIPANRVSVSSGMPHMGVDPAEMTARFLAGERIDLDTLATRLRELPPSAHTMIDYPWEARP